MYSMSKHTSNITNKGILGRVYTSINPLTPKSANWHMPLLCQYLMDFHALLTPRWSCEDLHFKGIKT